jgi:heme-degrading monooxygenase HmoA
MKIARLWQGVVPAAKEAAYRAFLEREVLPEIRDTPGNRGVVVLRREEGEHVRVLVISYWDSLDAIRAFAGDDVERAHYRPGALEFLVDPEPFATHYEVLADL